MLPGLWEKPFSPPVMHDGRGSDGSDGSDGGAVMAVTVGIVKAGAVSGAWGEGGVGGGDCFRLNGESACVWPLLGSPSPPGLGEVLEGVRYGNGEPKKAWVCPTGVAQC